MDVQADLGLSCPYMPEDTLHGVGHLMACTAGLHLNPSLATYLAWRLVKKLISIAILLLPLIQEGKLSVTGKKDAPKFWLAAKRT